MPQRPDLNSFSAADRTNLVNLMLQYITDVVVDMHPTIQHSGEHLFTGHRTYIEGMENFLSSQGASQFVPLPKWDPVNEVPPEFRVMRQTRQDGTPWVPTQPNLPPVQNPNADPNRAMPAQFAPPAVCSFPNGDVLGDAANPWHGGVHGQIGGVFGQFRVASAVPLFWCWHAFVDEIYYDWQRCPRVRGWKDPTQVPGWFGWENQGGGVAVADVSGNSRPDLVVFHIDNPEGDNHGYYRIGWNFDANGNVTDGWTDPILVPGWFGWENQGGGVAVADISGTSLPDLLVFHIDNPEGDNHGYYRIGWDLDANGNVTGGWTDPILVPGWFGWENQGGGIAAADISGNGRPDLVVFHIDNPEGDNHGYYRVGWNLDADGSVIDGWSAIFPVPGWFGWENQGGGVTVADIHGHGQRDLVVFHIDNPEGDNHGYYRIGWHLDANGTVGHGWSNPKTIPGWFGWENQGGGVAINDVDGNGRPDLIGLHIDNPEGDNHGYYRIGWNLDTNGDVS